MTSTTGPVASGWPAVRTRTLGVTVLAMVVIAAMVLNLHAVRVTAAVLGCLVLPGLGWARRLRLRDLGDTLALTVVLSMSSTAVVATAMVLTARWSPLGGLIALSGIAVLGHVPVRALGAGAGAFLFGRPLVAAGGLEEPWVVGAGQAEEEWRDWYAGVRRQVDEERRRREAEGEAAEREWRDWYADVQRREDEERSQRESERESAELEWSDWHAVSPVDLAEDEPGRPRTDSAGSLN